MKKLLAIFFLAISIAVVHAATLLPNGKQQFFDASGNPLVGGFVYFYTPNTQTPKDTWQDADQTILNTNPVVLDGSGEAVIYGSGVYRQVVKDVDGNLIWDQPTQDTSASSINFSSSVGGTANAITVSSSGFTSQDGQIISFVAVNDNSGSTTLDAGSGAIPLLKDTVSGPLALQGGEVKTGNVINAQYISATNSFHLVGNNLASVLITGGTINNTTIGATTATTGRFTNIEVTSTTPPASGHGVFVAPGFSTSFSNGGLTNFATSSNASAVNFLAAIGTVASSDPALTSNGSDTNIGMAFSLKGTGSNFTFYANNFARTVALMTDVASAVNYLQLYNMATGTAPGITALGADTNINVAINPKGTGVIQCGACNTNTTTGSANLIINSSGLIQKTTSSIRFKKEVVTYDRGIEDIMKLRPVYFRSKIPTDSQRRQAGLIAEEVSKTGFDEFVEHNNPQKPNEATGIQYTAMNALFINALKDLKHENDNLRARIRKLERKTK